MTNLEKYNNILKRNFHASDEDLTDDILVYNRFKKWESLAHMETIADLEEAFDVTFETIEITSFNKYSVGIDILKSKGIDME